MTSILRSLSPLLFALTVALAASASAAAAEPTSAAGWSEPVTFVREASEQSPPGLAAALRPFVHPIEIRDGRIHGAGADLLVERAREAQFVLVGEQHSAAGIAEMITALYRAVQPLGYDVAAIETGPWGARRLEALLEDDDPKALAAFFEQAPHVFVLPFYSLVEEALFARAVVELGDRPGRVLWGLDQEFVAGAPILFERLAELAETEDQARLVKRLSSEVLADEQMFVGSASRSRLEELETAFAGAGEEAGAIIEAMIVSNRIYGPFVRGEGSVYAANREREDLMKSTFLRHYEEAAKEGKPPRVFLKFGANHVVRGVSRTHVQSLGSFVAALAMVEGRSAYHVHVDCRGGETRTPHGTTAPCESYYLGDGGLAAHLPAGRPVVVDLEALRGERAILRQLDAESRFLIDAYDAYLVVPDTAPATLFPGRLPDLP